MDDANATLANSATSALLSAKSSLANNTHLNGVSISNGAVILLLNSSSVSDDNSNRIAIIVNNADYTDGAISGLKSLNLITGVSVTNATNHNYIVPGALLSNNFDVTYGIGNLTITPAPLTVKTEDAPAITYGANPAPYVDDITGLQYADVLTDVVAIPSVTHALINKATNNPAASPVGAGNYNIIPSALNLVSPSNYYVPDANYLSGNLTVNKAILYAQAQQDAVKNYGTPNPDFTISYSPFVAPDNASVLKLKQASTTTATTTSSVGNYPITLADISPANVVGNNPDAYADNYYIYNSPTPGNLTILPVPLTITADNKVKLYGAPVPALTVSYSGLAGGDQSVVLTTSPAGQAVATTAATATSAAGMYAIVPYPGHSHQLFANYLCEWYAGSGSGYTYSEGRR